MDLKNQTQKRTIKFRGRCAFSGTWRYGFYYVSKGYHIIRDENDRESIVLEKTVGEFTGLHDKNGKEIFEGGLIDFGNSNPVEVKFENGAFTVFSEPLGWDFDSDDVPILTDFKYCEISEISLKTQTL